MVAAAVLEAPMAAAPHLALGRRLRQLRVDQRPKLTQEDLARRLRCSASFVSALERGLYRLEPDMIAAYVREVGADYTELSRLSGYLVDAAIEWTPPPDKAPQLRTLAERLTPNQLTRAVRVILDLYDESAERDVPVIPPEPGTEERAE